MMDPYEKYTALKYLEKAWEEVNKLPTLTECKDCSYCSIHYCNFWKSTIPDDIMLKGCEKWNFTPINPPL